MLKKRKQFKKNDILPSKINLRKHLNADALFATIRQEFDKIPDFRSSSNPSPISITDSLMSAFAMFSLKFPSLLQFDQTRKEAGDEFRNLQNIYGVENVPCDSRMREINDEIDPKKNISPSFKAIFRQLQRGKAMEQMVFYDGCYLLNLDGTGIFSSKKLNAPFCMKKKNKKSGQITYYTQMLGASIVHPDFKEVIPLGCNYKCGYYAALFIEPPAQYSSHLLFALSVLRDSISSAISFFHHAPVSFNLD